MIDLRDIPAIDQHAHNLLHPAAVARRPYPDPDRLLGGETVKRLSQQ